MIKKLILAIGATFLMLAGIAYVLYLTNPAPTVPAISAQAVASGKPFVVKLHAKWCAICMTTKDVWTQIDATYRGRVNLVVFDFTNQVSTDASRAEAKRLGLEKFFDENEGWTGTVAVLDGRTREERATLHGGRDFADYRAAIDAALK